PSRAAIARFPNTAGDRAEIISLRIAWNTFDRESAPTAERPDLAPLHPIKQLLVDCAGSWWRGRRLDRCWRSCGLHAWAFAERSRIGSERKRDESKLQDRQPAEMTERRSHPPK